MTAQDAYEFGADTELETRRLGAVERAFDPASRLLLLRTGVQPGWRCWEVGAGSGSIARWLAGVIGPEGRVLATDLDDQRFDAGDTDVAFLRHDVTAGPPPDQHFDLVHARFLLEHLPDPRAVIDRLLDSLRPGGAIVLEDSAGLEVDVSPAVPAFGRITGAWEAAGRAVGWDASYGLRLMSDLRAAGVTGLQGQLYRQMAAGGEDWTHLCFGLERLRAELVERGVTPAELQGALGSLADSRSLITGPPVIVAWGQA